MRRGRYQAVLVKERAKILRRMAAVVLGKLNLFVPSRSDFGDGPIEVGLQYLANGVELKSNWVDSMGVKAAGSR